MWNLSNSRKENVNFPSYKFAKLRGFKLGVFWFKNQKVPPKHPENPSRWNLGRPRIKKQNSQVQWHEVHLFLTTVFDVVIWGDVALSILPWKFMETRGNTWNSTSVWNENSSLDLHWHHLYTKIGSKSSSTFARLPWDPFHPRKKAHKSLLCKIERQLRLIHLTWTFTSCSVGLLSKKKTSGTGCFFGKSMQILDLHISYIYNIIIIYSSFAGDNFGILSDFGQIQPSNNPNVIPSLFLLKVDRDSFPAAGGDLNIYIYPNQMGCFQT